MIDVGDRVRYSPNPRDPALIMVGTVERFRSQTRRGAIKATYKLKGWADVRGDDGVLRSIRPSRCEKI